MTETTGSATGLDDLFTKLMTWVGSQTGWTVDEAVNTFDSGNQCAISKGNLYVQWRWSTALPDSVAMYQSTGYSAATRAGSMPGDSSNGYNANNNTTESAMDSERCIQNMGNTAYPNYYFYTNPAGDYLHIVVEINTDEFRHFGCGNLDKFADWDGATGGEYAYGQQGVTNASSTQNTTHILLDAGSTSTSGNGEQMGGTMRMGGWPGQTTQVWANVWGNRTVTEVNDTAGNPRLTVTGGARGGFTARSYGWMAPGSGSGLAPTYSLPIIYINRVPTTPEAYLMGYQPDIRGVLMAYLAPGDTFTLGAQTWRVFPTVRRAEGAAAGDTDFQGWAYLTNG